MQQIPGWRVQLRRCCGHARSDGQGRLSRVDPRPPAASAPNPKLGTVTNDVAKAIMSLAGRPREYRADRYGTRTSSSAGREFHPRAAAENYGAGLRRDPAHEARRGQGQVRQVHHRVRYHDSRCFRGLLRDPRLHRVRRVNRRFSIEEQGPRFGGVLLRVGTFCTHHAGCSVGADLGRPSRQD